MALHTLNHYESCLSLALSFLGGQAEETASVATGETLGQVQIQVEGLLA
jgi:hypothetical protein